MTHRYIPLVLLCLCFSSCDKAKDLANQAKSAVENKIVNAGGATEGTKPDPELQKLVDQTAEGVIFRKDLPFPSKFEVRTTSKDEIDGRYFQSSAIGKHAEHKKGTRIVITKLERAGDQIRYTLEQSSFTLPPVEGAEEPKAAVVDPLKQAAPASKPMTFRKSGKTWDCSASDGFRAAALSRELSPVFDQLLTENALAPRELWLGKRRFKTGDQVPVSGDSLSMLVSGKASGRLNLTFEKSEAVEGHPCGVFSITGEYSRKQFPDFEGELTDQDVTIESGRIWLSLLYPVVLKQELSTIQTTQTGGQGGNAERGQGTVKVSLIRDWKSKP